MGKPRILAGTVSNGGPLEDGVIAQELEQVIAWVKSQLDVAEIEGNLAGQIAALKAPKTASGLPWAGVAE